MSLLGPGRHICVTEGPVVVANERSSSDPAERWTLAVMRQLGGAFGVAVLVALFAGAGSYVSAHAFTNGFTAAIGTAAGLSFAGALVGLAVSSRETHGEPRGAPNRSASLAEAEAALPT